MDIDSKVELIDKAIEDLRKLSGNTMHEKTEQLLRSMFGAIYVKGKLDGIRGVMEKVGAIHTKVVQE